MWPDENISELIIKHLAGETSSSEEQSLQEWLSIRTENQKEYDAIALLWETSGRISATPPHIDVEAEWKVFRNRHFRNEVPVIPLRFKQVLRYAAVLLIGVLGGTWYFSGHTTYQTATGERQLVTLSDGTEILLSENTVLEVPRTFNWTHRQLNLSGEAFFEVAKNPEKPFIAAGPKTALQVLGTAFHLIATELENKVEVSEGKVAYWTSQHRDTVILIQQESAVFQKNILQKSIITDEHYKSWQDGIFSFDQKLLAGVLKQLQDHYIFDVTDPNGILEGDCTFTGSFKGQDLDDILKELALVTGLEYHYDNGRLTLQNLDCP